jgi:hypothetical protein
VTASSGYGGRRFRHLNLLPVSLRDLVAVGRGVARGRHGRAEFKKRRPEREGEVGDALGNEHARYLKESGESVTPDVSVTNFHIVRHRGSCRSGSWEGLMGRVADICWPTPHDDSRSYGGGDSEVKVKTGHWRAAPAAAWEQDPKRCKFPGGSTPARGSPARGLQPGHHRSRFVPRRPGKHSKA